MLAPNTIPCMLCTKPTTGSIGAAGIRWSMICQPCKDAEDKAAEAMSIASIKATRASMMLLNPDKSCECSACGGYGAEEQGDGTICMTCEGEGEVMECHNCGHNYKRGECCRNCRW